MLKTIVVKIIIWLTFALACAATAACGGSVSGPAPALEAVATDPTPDAGASPSCYLDDTINASLFCETSQFFIERCNVPIPNPGGVDCNGPRGFGDQKIGDMWCCK